MKRIQFLLASLIGAGLAVLAVSVFDLGGSDRTVTVVEQAPLSTQTADSKGDAGLTPREIYRRDSKGVVFIEAEVVERSNSPFDFFPTERRGVSTGSGFVIDRDGYIFTNAHVVSQASKVTVSFEDDRTAEAKVVGRDVSNDLALLKVDPDGLKLNPLELGNSKNVQVGDPTIAIGNPFGLERTLTTGVVSALQRKITAPNGFSIENVIQTDAAINPGNSGGPLIDAAGRVIGINSQIATRSDGSGGGGNVGIGFAVPVDTAKKVLPQLKENGSVERAYLGIEGLTIEDSLVSALNLSLKQGVLVQNVSKGSPADKAGIKGGDTRAQIGGQQITLGGDVIVELNGKDVKTMDEVASDVGNRKPGDEITLTVIHEGKKKDVKVKLGKRPDKQVIQ